MKKDETNSKMNINDIDSISIALQCDAEFIYDLKVDALGKYLDYTIYQTSKSVAYLRKLLIQGADSTGNFFFVAKQNSKVVGYYHAVHCRSELFLNYIVVKEEFRRLGLGKKLLNHYETLAGTLSCITLALDVFESNTDAFTWYCKEGYVPNSVKTLTSLALGWNGRCLHAMDFDLAAWRSSCQEEHDLGFSKIVCSCGPGKFTLGLIAGHVCKLLSFDGIDISEAIAAINNRLSGTRDTLIISSQEIPADLPLIATSTVIHFIKHID